MSTELEERFNVSMSEGKYVKAVKQIRYGRHVMVKADKDVAKGNVSFLNFAEAIQACWFSTVEEQVHILEALIGRGSEESVLSANNDSRNGVFLSGILPPPASVIKAIESAGLRVVGNDIASLGRSYASMREIREDPAAYFLDSYYQHFPCLTLLYTGDGRTTWLT